MSFNPFQEKPKKTESTVMNWKQMAPKPYDKNTVDPYTKTRIILMSGTEFEGVWSGHQRFRSTQDMDVRREVTYIRRLEQQQQKMLAALKPLDETILETTIAYEQLAVDLTAFLAKRATNKSGVGFRAVGRFRSSLPICGSFGKRRGDPRRTIGWEIYGNHAGTSYRGAPPLPLRFGKISDRKS